MYEIHIRQIITVTAPDEKPASERFSAGRQMKSHLEHPEKPLYTQNVAELEHIQFLCKQGKIRWTNHILTRLLQRNIKQTDVENAILTGYIIENYPEDYPYPSCLILGSSLDNKNLHVVCGIANEEIYMITAYQPDSCKWNKYFNERSGT